MPKIGTIAELQEIREGIKKAIGVRRRTIPKIMVGMASVQTGCIWFCSNEVLVDIIKPGYPRISYKHVLAVIDDGPFEGIPAHTRGRLSCTTVASLTPKTSRITSPAMDTPPWPRCSRRLSRR